jgi:hypothetical protein
MDESGISGDNQVSVIQIAPTEFSRAIFSISSTFFGSDLTFADRMVGISYLLGIFIFFKFFRA